MKLRQGNQPDIGCDFCMADDDFSTSLQCRRFFRAGPASGPDPADSAKIRRAGRGFSVSGGNLARDGGCAAERSRRRPSKPRNGARGKERSDGKPAFRISGCRQRRRNRVRRGGQGRPGAGGRRPCGDGRGGCGSCIVDANFPARWNQTEGPHALFLQGIHNTIKDLPLSLVLEAWATPGTRRTGWT